LYIYVIFTGGPCSESSACEFLNGRIQCFCDVGCTGDGKVCSGSV